jgi:hypothetical protein
VRDYVIEHLADDDAVLVIDETGFCAADGGQRKSNRARLAETAEGRRPVEGKVSSNTYSGLSAGLSMTLKQQACGSVASKPT